MKTSVTENRSLPDNASGFSFWPIMWRSCLWSLPVAVVGGLVFGVLGIYGHLDSVPLVGSIASNTKVVSISTTLAVVATLVTARVAFDEMGVFIGFFVLSIFGVGVFFAMFWFGGHAFQFFRGMVAGGMISPAVCFPVVALLVARGRTSSD